MARTSSSVNVNITADARPATAEFERLEDKIGSLEKTFTTVSGQMKQAVSGFVADSAMELGQKFAGDVFAAAGEYELMAFKAEKAFDDQIGEARKFADEMGGLFGLGPESVMTLMSDAAFKLDEEGWTPVIADIAELAGVLSGFYPQLGSAAEVMQELTQGLATGEWGQLEDYLGNMEDITAETMTLGEMTDALKDKSVEAYNAMDAGALDAKMQMNELKAAYDELVQKTAGFALEVIDKWKQIEGGVDSVVNKLTPGYEGGLPTQLDVVMGGVDVLETGWGKAWDFMAGKSDEKSKEIKADTDAMAAGFDVITDAIGGVIERIGDIPSSLPGPNTQTGRWNWGTGQWESDGAPGNPDYVDPDYQNEGRQGGPTEMASSGQRGTLAVTINQTVQPGANAADAGRMIVEAIDSYQRASGSEALVTNPIGG